MCIRKAYFRTGRPTFGDIARREVAELMDRTQSPLISALMNYDPQTGKSITGFPPVHFVGGKDGFGLIGFGSVGCSIVEDVTPILHRRLSAYKKQIILADVQLLSADLEKRPYELSYQVPRMVVQTKHSHSELMKDPAKGSRHLERLFMASLNRQAEVLDIAVPEGAYVKFRGASRTFNAKSERHTQAKLGIVNAHFDVNLRMTGVWAVGYMLSKGYGQFNASRQLGLMPAGE